MKSMLLRQMLTTYRYLRFDDPEGDLDMSKDYYRIGQIVPSSNTTMETELPLMFKAREQIAPEKFTFHASRMRMKKVTLEELKTMDADSSRCALELSDAKVDVLGYACLVAIMSMGHGYHRMSEDKLHQVTVKNKAPAPIVTSAGALVEGLKVLGAKKISLIAPYMKPLTELVLNYLREEGLQIIDSISLEIPDNTVVGKRDPWALVNIAQKLNITGADAVVLSACVQMPSLQAISQVESMLNIPVISAATATAFQLLHKLNLDCIIPNAGAFLSGVYSPNQAK